MELDVTVATELLAGHDPPQSLTAFVIASVARAVASHPEVHAYRNWRGQLVMHHHVDVSAIVEVPTPQGPFPLVHTVRDADVRDVGEITEELHRVKGSPMEGADVVPTHHLVRTATRVPGLIRFAYWVFGRSVRMHQRSGTVGVTAVGMFADGGGFAIAPLTLMPLQVVVGGLAERPWVVGDHVEVRNVLDLTVSIDHNVVDGGPATRFGAELRHRIEDAGVLGPERGTSGRGLRSSQPLRRR
jgi:pyruvate/2-oxoglutarate dehydrogenase complex dihydrolipoamide acyltransferase (E2) component